MKSEKILGFAGLAMVVGFFLPLFGNSEFGISGWEMMIDGDLGATWFTRLALLGLPIAGLLTAFAGFVGDAKQARSMGLISGVGILGVVGYKVSAALLSVFGWGMLLILAAAIVAIVVSLRKKK